MAAKSSTMRDTPEVISTVGFYTFVLYIVKQRT